jgi:hypothetical protein
MNTLMAFSAHPRMHAFVCTLLDFCRQGAFAAGVLRCLLAPVATSINVEVNFHIF